MLFCKEQIKMKDYFKQNVKSKELWKLTENVKWKNLITILNRNVHEN